MNLVPLRDDLLFPLEQTFNKFFDEFFSHKGNTNVAKANSLYPKINSYIDGDSYKLSFAVPGVQPDDLDVEYGHNKTVTVRGKAAKKYSSSNEGEYFIRELRMSSFERTVMLPENIEGKPQDAVLSDGILTLIWKLTPKESKDRIRISFKAE